MLNRLAGALVALAVLGSGSVHADEPDQPAARVEAQRFLQNLVGDWRITRKIRDTVEANLMDASWVLQHQFVQVHMVDVAQPPRYEALVLIGYQEKADRFVAYWCDSFGPDYAAPGYGKRRGNSIDFTFAYADGPFHNTFTWDAAAAAWTFRMESVDKSGRRTLFAEDTVVRR